MNNLFLVISLLFLLSCNSIEPKASSPSNVGEMKNADPGDKIEAVKINPEVGATYHYLISNETEMKMDANGKEVVNKNKVDVELVYHITKDSSGNYLVKMQYDRIRMHTKNGDNETVMEAVKGKQPSNESERILSALAESEILVMMNKSGEVDSIKGFDAVGEKIAKEIENKTPAERNMIQDQWKKQVEQSLIKQNIDQLFKILPDSITEVGEKWTTTVKQKDQFGITAITEYQLEKVRNNRFFIKTYADLQSDNTPTMVMNYNVVATINGRQEGAYQIDAQTGILMEGKQNSKLTGSILLMRREFPVSVLSNSIIKGTKK